MRSPSHFAWSSIFRFRLATSSSCFAFSAPSFTNVIFSFLCDVSGRKGKEENSDVPSFGELVLDKYFFCLGSDLDVEWWAEGDETGVGIWDGSEVAGAEQATK